VRILYLFSHCVLFALLIIDFIVILHVRLIRVLLKINQSFITVYTNKRYKFAFVKFMPEVLSVPFFPATVSIVDRVTW